MANTDELFADLAAADAAGDTELAGVIASRIKQVEAAAPAPSSQPAAQDSPGLLSRVFGDKVAPVGLSGLITSGTQPASVPAPAASVPSGFQYPPEFDPGEIREGPGFFGEIAGRARAAMRTPVVERNIEQGAQFVRYGAPVVAGLATGGPGAVPVAAGTGFFSDIAAQGMEMMTGKRDEISKGEALASGIMAGVPMAQAGIIKPFQPVLKRAGQVAVRAGAQLGMTAAAEQGAEAVRSPETYNPPTTPKEVWAALTTPTALIGAGLAGAGAAAEGWAKSAAAAQAARAGRGDDAGMLMTELDPRYASLEARRIIRKDAKVMNEWNNLYSDQNSWMADLVGNAPNSNQIASEIAPLVNRRTELAKAAQDAEAAASRAMQDVFAAQSSKVGDVKAIEAKAKSLAQDAALKRAAFEFEAKNMLGGGPTPTLGALSPATVTQGLQNALESTVSQQKAAIGDLRAQVGIGINDPITTKELILRRIDELASDSKNRLHGVDAKNAAKAYIEKAFPAPAVEPPPVILGPSGKPLTGIAPKGTPISISAERYLDLRDEIAEGLEENGMIRSVAGKLASEMYSAVRNSTDDYIAAVAKDKLPAWTNYNKTVANWFKARDNEFIRDFISPRTGELRAGKAAEFVNSLMAGKEGVQTLAALNGLADSIAATGTPAAQSTANAFKEQVSQYIAKGVLESAVVNRGVGVASEAAQFDPKKLYQAVNKMASNQFDTARLGLGKPEDLNRLARMTENKLLTQAEVRDFFNDVGSIGGNAAAARLQYRRELRALLVSSPDVRRSAANLKRMVGLAKTAKLDAAAAQAELAKASADPLVKIFDNGNFGFKADLTANDLSAAVQSMDMIPAPQLRQFVAAMPAPLREKLSARKLADVLQGYKDVVPGVTPKADIKQIRMFLYDQSDTAKIRRDGLREIMGGPAYKNFTDSIEKMAPRFRAQAAVAENLPIADTALKDTLSGAFAAGGAISGSLVTGTLGASAVVNGMRGLVDRGRYSTYHLLFINPKTARAFASVGYSLDKFANQSGLHRVALQIAEREDEERNQGIPE